MQKLSPQLPKLRVTVHELPRLGEYSGSGRTFDDFPRTDLRTSPAHSKHRETRSLGPALRTETTFPRRHCGACPTATQPRQCFVRLRHLPAPEATGLAISKPDVISFLEQGKEPWTVEEVVTEGLCPVLKSRFTLPLMVMWSLSSQSLNTVVFPYQDSPKDAAIKSIGAEEPLKSLTGFQKQQFEPGKAGSRSELLLKHHLPGLKLSCCYQTPKYGGSISGVQVGENRKFYKDPENSSFQDDWECKGTFEIYHRNQKESSSQVITTHEETHTLRQQTSPRAARGRRPENSETSATRTRSPRCLRDRKCPPQNNARALRGSREFAQPSVRVRGLTNVVRETRTQWAPGPLPGGILVATAACRTGRVWVRQRAGLLLPGRGCPPLLKAGLGDGTGRRFGNGARVRTDAHGGGARYPRGTDALVRGRPWGRGFEPKGAGTGKAAQARRVAADFWRAEAPWDSVLQERPHEGEHGHWASGRHITGISVAEPNIAFLLERGPQPWVMREEDAGAPGAESESTQKSKELSLRKRINGETYHHERVMKKTSSTVSHTTGHFHCDQEQNGVQHQCRFQRKYFLKSDNNDIPILQVRNLLIWCNKSSRTDLTVPKLNTERKSRSHGQAQRTALERHGGHTDTDTGHHRCTPELTEDCPFP
ncbi:hypothetical protein E5288_WYG007418 [Bos mutus]|uniref:KRAB domain-containing protein n=1 Tax=Bos mutus TaxID=72004 RepID=A0A6B0S582_9CETA|nr:hypothetical protein [Bos mutus]